MKQQPTTDTIDERIDGILANIGTEVIADAVTVNQSEVWEAKHAIKQLLADFAEHITPEKKPSLMPAGEARYADGWDDCIDTINQNTERELR